MYNLLVSGNKEEWKGDPFVLEIGRCVREYTDTELTKRFGDLSAENVKELRRFPCIFAYESVHQKDPKFGVIRGVRIRQKNAVIEYEIKDIEKFLTAADLNDLALELDIPKYEMNRTHWAVKDVNLARELQAKGIVLPHWARTMAKAVDISTHIFDVALSFPGEVRHYVEPVVAALERNIGPNSYFYDNNYVSQLARPSLDTLLQDIYRNRAKLVVVFLCSNYQDKEWCGIEFKAIKEIMMERKNDMVMFIKMDDGHVEGVFKTDGYIDGRKYGPDDVARFIQERVDLLKNRSS
jgi:hypothetical protein